MKYPKQLIVVEGKNDESRLKSIWANIKTFSVGGSSISKNDINYIELMNNKVGVIIFTDPDGPGEKIRKKIQSQLTSDVSHCFIRKNDARTQKKVGVEHASTYHIKTALKNILKFRKTSITLSFQDYIKLSLCSQKGSKNKREQLCRKLTISYCNSKQLYKRLNWLGHDFEGLKKILDMV